MCAVRDTTNGRNYSERRSKLLQTPGNVLRMSLVDAVELRSVSVYRSANGWPGDRFAASTSGSVDDRPRAVTRRARRHWQDGAGAQPTRGSPETSRQRGRGRPGLGSWRILGCPGGRSRGRSDARPRTPEDPGLAEGPPRAGGRRRSCVARRVRGAGVHLCHQLRRPDLRQGSRDLAAHRQEGNRRRHRSRPDAVRGGTRAVAGGLRRRPRTLSPAPVRPERSGARGVRRAFSRSPRPCGGSSRWTGCATCSIRFRSLRGRLRKSTRRRVCPTSS